MVPQIQLSVCQQIVARGYPVWPLNDCQLTAVEGGTGAVGQLAVAKVVIFFSGKQLKTRSVKRAGWIQLSPPERTRLARK